MLRNAFSRHTFWLALFAALTVWNSRPLASNLSTRILGDAGDPLLITSTLEWTWHTALGDGTARFFDLPMFWPHTDVLTWSEHLFGFAALGWPLYAATGNPILTYNLLALAALTLNGWAMCWLAWDRTRRMLPALLAGLVLYSARYFYAQQGHLQSLPLFWGILALLFLHRWTERRTLTPAALSGLCAAALLLCANNLGAFFALLYWPLAALLFLRHRAYALPRAWAALPLLAAPTLAVYLTLLQPYQHAHAQMVFGRSLDEVRAFSARPGHLVAGLESIDVWRRARDAYSITDEPVSALLSLVPLLILLAGTALALAHAWRAAPRTRAWLIALPLALILSFVLAYNVRGEPSLSLVLAGTPYRANWSLLLSSSLLCACIFWVALRLLRSASDDAPGTCASPASESPPRAPSAETSAPAHVSPDSAESAIRNPQSVIEHRTAHSSTAQSTNADHRYLLALYVALAWLALILAWGPRITRHHHDLALLPYSALLLLLDGFDGVRVPARFGAIALIAVALLAALLLHRLSRRPLIAWLVFLAALPGLYFAWREDRLRSVAVPDVADLRAAGAWVATTAPGSVVAVLPILPFSETLAHAECARIWALTAPAAAGRLHLLNGYSGYFSDLDLLLRARWSERFTAAEAAETAHLGVDYLIVDRNTEHSGLFALSATADNAAAANGLRLMHRAGNVDVYALPAAPEPDVIDAAEIWARGARLLDARAGGGGGVLLEIDLPAPRESATLIRNRYAGDLLRSPPAGSPAAPHRDRSARLIGRVYVETPVLLPGETTLTARVRLRRGVYAGSLLADLARLFLRAHRFEDVELVVAEDEAMPR